MEKPSQKPIAPEGQCTIFSEHLKREVLSELTFEELIRFADTHELLVQFKAGSRSDGPINIVLCAKHPGTERYERTIDANDPLWEKLGGFPKSSPEKHNRYELTDLPVIAHYNQRVLQKEKEGYFESVRSIYEQRKARVKQLAGRFCDLVVTYMADLDFSQKTLLFSEKDYLVTQAKAAHAELTGGSELTALKSFERVKELLSQSASARLVTEQTRRNLQSLHSVATTVHVLLSYVSHSFVQINDFPHDELWLRRDYMGNYQRVTDLLLRLAHGDDPTEVFRIECEEKTPQEYAQHPYDQTIDQLEKWLDAASGIKNEPPSHKSPYR